MVDIDFVRNNVPNILFYTFYNTYTGYLFWTRTYAQNEYFITSIVGTYEFLNTFYEFRHRPVKKEMVVHHALTSANTFLLLYCYTRSPEIVKDIMYCQTLIMSSTLYLNIRHTFPKLFAPRLVFFGTFFYYRFYLTYPYVYKFITGAYGDTALVRVFYVNCTLLYGLSVYWGFLILRIAYNALKLKVLKP